MEHERIHELERLAGLDLPEAERHLVAEVLARLSALWRGLPESSGFIPKANPDNPDNRPAIRPEHPADALILRENAPALDGHFFRVCNPRPGPEES